MANTTFGLSLYPNDPVREMIKFAQLADKLGFDRLWVGDSQLIWRNAYVSLTAFALNTSKISLGTGVTNPVTRHPTVTANAAVTLNELTSGRLILGIGRGDSALATMGVQMAKLALLEETVAKLRGLIRGEIVRFNGKECRLELGGANIPIYVSAIGPKMLQMAGRIADGVIMTVGADERFVRAGLELIARGAEERGRNMSDLNIICWVHCSLSDDAQRAVDDVRVATSRLIMCPLPVALDTNESQVAAEVERAYNYSHHLAVGARHSKFVPDWLVRKFAVAGTPEECRERIARLASIPGIRGIDIDPYGDRLFIIERFYQDIIRTFQA